MHEPGSPATSLTRSSLIPDRAIRTTGDKHLCLSPASPGTRASWPHIAPPSPCVPVPRHHSVSHGHVKQPFRIRHPRCPSHSGRAPSTCPPASSILAFEQTEASTCPSLLHPVQPIRADLHVLGGSCWRG